MAKSRSKTSPPPSSPPSAPSLADQAVKFINALTHTGDFAGEPFKLRPWQEDQIVRPMFREKAPGELQYQTVFIALPRKQGKTELIAAVLLFLLIALKRLDRRIFSASGDRAQAALIFRAAASMVRQNANLDRVCRVYDGGKKIDYEPLDCHYEALSSDAPGKHGLNPSAVLFDEVHVLPDRKLHEALTTAFGGRKAPLKIYITTAGYDRTSLCYELWQYARKVRDGVIDDPTFLPLLWEAKPEEDWTSEEVWHRVMPALGDFCSIDFIRQECKTAREIPSYENSFRQLYLNQWTEQATRWLQVERWQASGRINGHHIPPHVLASELRGESCYGGLDLGVTGDMSAYANLFKLASNDYRFLLHFWAPREGKWRKEPRNRDLYDLWHKQGYLTYTEGETTDHQQIEEEIVALNETYPLKVLNADRAFASQMLSNLFNRHGLPVKGISQGPVVMSEPITKFEELTLAGHIHHGDNPILNWNVANAVVRNLRTGLRHLDKENATERIDGLSACLNALAGAIALDGTDDTGPSVYETRGLIFL